MFGREFADALDKPTLNQWTGPIKSSFGLHIIQVTERKTGRNPALDEVRDAVSREWSNEKRKTLQDVRFDELLKRYDVIIENLPKDAAKR